MLPKPTSELHRQHAHAKAIRARLFGISPAVKKVPSLTLVRPELLADRAKKLVNAGGRPGKLKARPDANDHVFAFRVYQLQQKEQRNPTEHAKMICFAARVPWDLVIGKSRRRDLTGLRNRIAWELRQRGLSFPQIGAILNRDHTSILHSVRRVDAAEGDREAKKWIGRKNRQSLESQHRIRAEKEAAL
ncbi:hypothetical protein ABIA22_002275 [Sinorhizobium fredii]|uniref:helix-turn-helix domain-containing protein n=1 Tax=Rhizobium fredii TaxID=380 RepID=UPI0035123EDC